MWAALVMRELYHITRDIYDERCLMMCIMRERDIHNFLWRREFVWNGTQWFFVRSINISKFWLKPDSSLCPRVLDNNTKLFLFQELVLCIFANYRINDLDFSSLLWAPALKFYTHTSLSVRFNVRHQTMALFGELTIEWILVFLS